MHRRRLPLVTHQPCRLVFGHPGLGTPHDSQHGGGGADCAPFEDGDLGGGVASAQAARWMHQLGRDVDRVTTGQATQDVNQECGDEGRHDRLVGFGRLQVLPTNHADPRPGTDPRGTERVLEPRGAVTRLAHQAQRLRQRDVDWEAGQLGVPEALVADDQHATVAGTEEEQGLLEPWVEAGQEEEVRGMLPVAVNDDPVHPRRGVECLRPDLVFRGRDAGASVAASKWGSGTRRSSMSKRLPPLEDGARRVATAGVVLLAAPRARDRTTPRATPVATTVPGVGASGSQRRRGKRPHSTTMPPATSAREPMSTTR